MKGNHRDKYSIYGCKSNLYPDNPILRKLIRGSICAGIAILFALIFLIFPCIRLYEIFKEARVSNKR